MEHAHENLQQRIADHLSDAFFEVVESHAREITFLRNRIETRNNALVEVAGLLQDIAPIPNAALLDRVKRLIAQPVDAVPVKPVSREVQAFELLRQSRTLIGGDGFPYVDNDGFPRDRDGAEAWALARECVLRDAPTPASPAGGSGERQPESAT